MFSFTRNFFGLPSPLSSHNSSLYQNILKIYGLIQDIYNLTRQKNAKETRLETDPNSSGSVDMGRNVGYQGEMPASLDSDSHGALMLGTGPGLASGFDLAAFRDILAQFGGVFIVYHVNFIAAKSTHLALGYVF
jgi:hypothetical protein